MTKTLLLNCSLKTTAGKPLIDTIGKFSECKVVHFSEVSEDYKVEASIDSIILSGSAARIVKPSHRTMFSGAVNLIRKCNLPILGICFGHQLLCWALGATVGSLDQPVLDCFEMVRIIEADPIFEGLPQNQPVLLAESHFDYVLRESLFLAGFVLLANSGSCPVEAVKHKHRSIYGVQFHPERTTVKNEYHPDGSVIIQNYYRYIVRR